jgi:hypothetical protein
MAHILFELIQQIVLSSWDKWGSTPDFFWEESTAAALYQLPSRE